jgi:hypothetical protein
MAPFQPHSCILLAFFNIRAKWKDGNQQVARRNLRTQTHTRHVYLTYEHTSRGDTGNRIPNTILHVTHILNFLKRTNLVHNFS